MANQSDRIEQEMHDLREEIEQFRKEKERVRSIVGKVGGMPSFNTKAFNIVFAVVVGGLLVACVVLTHSIEVILGELAIAAISVKLMYLLHNQQRVNHFQLWILSSIEWRLNELVKQLCAVHETVAENAGTTETQA
ncbi:MAG: hypothetical protein GF418_10520 [Chitinivibrionales bacterium]|nr:hypothetical protein [Chitinivibrionales bacterium]MBD3396047.1 hypothetical protein [Chitinivibrionales bacterium]